MINYLFAGFIKETRFSTSKPTSSFGRYLHTKSTGRSKLSSWLCTSWYRRTTKLVFSFYKKFSLSQIEARQCMLKSLRPSDGGANRIGLSVRSTTDKQQQQQHQLGTNGKRRSSLPHEAAIGNLLGNLTQLAGKTRSTTLRATGLSHARVAESERERETLTSFPRAIFVKLYTRSQACLRDFSSLKLS